jgi:hypothetical protein
LEKVSWAHPLEQCYSAPSQQHQPTKLVCLVEERGQMERLHSNFLEWNDSVPCLKERIESLLFLFGSRANIEWNRSVPCLVKESYECGHLLIFL